MIINMTGGGADTSVVTAKAADVLAGEIIVDADGNPVEGTMPNRGAISKTLDTSTKSYTIPEGYYSGGDVAIVTESKSVTPSTSAQTVTPSTGKVLESVSVDAIQTATQATPSISVNSSGLITASATQSAGYVSSGTKSATKQLTTQAAKTVTPSTSSQTAVESGKYTTGAVMVSAVPTQTKTATPSTSSQTIKPDSGKYLSQVTVNAVSTQTKTVTPTSSAQNVYPDSGKFLSQVTVEAIPSTYKAIHTGSMSSSAGSSSPRYKVTITDSSILSSSTTIPFLFLYNEDYPSHYTRYGFDVTNGTNLVDAEDISATVSISSGKIVIGADQPGVTDCTNYIFVI